MIDELKFMWQSTPHGALADVPLATGGYDRILVRRNRKGSRTFAVYINGKYQLTGDNLDQAKSMAARAYRLQLETGNVPPPEKP